jgi:hypothetical protein
MRVFVETSVIAYLTAEPSQNLIMASRQELTRLWWEEAASEFELFCSNTALKEAVKKDPKITQKQFECLDRLIDIPVTPSAVELAEHLVKVGVLPTEALPHALQIAVCVVYGVELLISWNSKHVANIMLQRPVAQACTDAGYKPTCICTPLNLSAEHLMRDDPIMEELMAAKAAMSKEANYSVAELARRLHEKYPPGKRWASSTNPR